MKKKYSYRPFVYPNTILYKLTVQRPDGRFVLVSKPDGKHYEKHVPRDDIGMRFNTQEQAFAGILDGHIPEDDDQKQLYTLVRILDLPTGKTFAGVTKSEDDWIKLLPDLKPGDCAIKTDWFAQTINADLD